MGGCFSSPPEVNTDARENNNNNSNSNNVINPPPAVSAATESLNSTATRTEAACMDAAAIAPPALPTAPTASEIIGNATDSKLPNSASPSPQRAADVASEPGVIPRGNSLVIPTHGRKRGSSVRLVMAPEDHLLSPKCRSPPTKSFEVAAQEMDKLDLPDAEKAAAAAAAGASEVVGEHTPTQQQQQQQRRFSGEERQVEAVNPLAAGREEQLLDERLEQAARRRDSLSSPMRTPSLSGNAGSSPLPNEDAADNISLPSALAEKVAAKERDSNERPFSETNVVYDNIPLAESVNTIGTSINNSGASSIRKEASMTAGDVASEPGVIPRGNSLVIPTHGRKRGSSVRLVMAPEDHLLSPRHKSPPRQQFEEAARDMSDMQLGGGGGGIVEENHAPVAATEVIAVEPAEEEAGVVG